MQRLLSLFFVLGRGATGLCRSVLLRARRSAGWKANAIRIWWSATLPSSCPGGTSDPARRDPTFQRWGPVPNVTLIPKGRPHEYKGLAVPSGLTAIFDQFPNPV